MFFSRFFLKFWKYSHDNIWFKIPCFWPITHYMALCKNIFLMLAPRRGDLFSYSDMSFSHYQIGYMIVKSFSYLFSSWDPVFEFPLPSDGVLDLESLGSKLFIIPKSFELFINLFSKATLLPRFEPSISRKQSCVDFMLLPAEILISYLCSCPSSPLLIAN